MSESYVPEPYVVEAVDTDGDGYQETTVLDSDGDGLADTALVDVDGDGYADVAAFDNVADGEFVADVVALDVDGDGYADVVADDTDLDGVFDSVTHPVDTPLTDANPYGATGHHPGTDEGTTYSGPFEGGAEAAPGGTGEGRVIAGEGGDAIYVDPDGGVSFSGSDLAGNSYSYDGG